MNGVIPQILKISLENKTFKSTENIPLNIPINGTYSQILYRLDNGEYKILSANTILANLSAGVHFLTAYPTDALGNSGTPKNVIFTVIDVVAPKVNILSIAEKTYDSPNISLNFTVNEEYSKLTYILDGQKNVTFYGNTTLLDLANGHHNITVYATDCSGNVGSSQTIEFTVDAPQPIPIVIFATASIVAVFLVSTVGLLFYRKKTRQQHL